MYIKTRSIAFPAYLPPYQDIPFCDVMLPLQKDSKMGIFKYLCDTFKYDYKICAVCPWLKGNGNDSDDDLDDVYMEMWPEDH